MHALSTGSRLMFRRIIRSPLFTVMTVATLALGVGSNTAIFTVVNGVLLKPLPFADSEHLVGIWLSVPGAGVEQLHQSPALHLTYQDENQVFEDLGMWRSSRSTVTGIGEPAQISSMQVTEGTLPLLGVRPSLGRLFSGSECRLETPETVILSYAYWQSRFGGDPAAIGQSMTIDGIPRQVIGVLPADLYFFDHDPELFLPIRLDPAKVRWGNNIYHGIARLRAGVTIDQANQEIERLIPVAVERYPLPEGISLSSLRDAGIASAIRPLSEDVIGDAGTVLWFLLCAVGLVLLVACANVANLCLTRAEGRQCELAIRSALGASRRRLVAGILTESVLLGLVGGFAGLWLAWGATHLLVALGPENLPRLHEISVDGPVLLFALLISAGAGLAVGLPPVCRLGPAPSADGLKQGRRGSTPGQARNRFRNILVVSQVAMALVLLVCSGLMIRSFMALRSVHPGFERPHEVLTLRIPIAAEIVKDPVQSARTHELVLRKLRNVPGVVAAGASTSITMDGATPYPEAVLVEEVPATEGETRPACRFKWITTGYFSTMENPILAGRDISWADIHDQAPVAVVNESFALRYWDSPASALGRRIRSIPSDSWRSIVGVVGDVHDDGVDKNVPVLVYWPMLMADFWDSETWVARSMAFAVRTSTAGAASQVQELRTAVWSINPDLPITNIQSLSEILSNSMARTSFVLVMLGTAALVSLLLGVIGLYGVIAYAVSQRTREIGVRMALGAEPRQVVHLILRQGLMITGVGVTAGLICASWLTRTMSAILFAVSPIDPVTFGSVAVVLTAVALLASYLPARGAARLDPIKSLRWE